MSTSSKKKEKGLFDVAFEKALFDNAYINFDDIFQHPELMEKFREFCELYHKVMIEKWFSKKNGKK